MCTHGTLNPFEMLAMIRLSANGTNEVRIGHIAFEAVHANYEIWTDLTKLLIIITTGSEKYNRFAIKCISKDLFETVKVAILFRLLCGMAQHWWNIHTTESASNWFPSTNVVLAKTFFCYMNLYSCGKMHWEIYCWDAEQGMYSVPNCICFFWAYAPLPLKCNWYLWDLHAFEMNDLRVNRTPRSVCVISVCFQLAKIVSESEWK